MVQGTLFGDSIPELGEQVGYRSSVVSKATGITQRRIDYWASQGYFEPTLLEAKGSGSRRLYTFKDILILQIYKRLLDTGISLKKIIKAKSILKERGVDDLSAVTLCSDGRSIFLVKSPEDIIDVLSGGQGVFAISIASIWSEVEGKLKQFKPSTVEEEMIPPSLRELQEHMRESRRISESVTKGI
ncbi:MAG: MerR family transcriptional regulator [Candidatus Ancillula sp.]|jgi:DNA-binding transcriptional MerR regulator|nr:MerR family transcriptional regulator [Candidatus Ancillula sp.]